MAHYIRILTPSTKVPSLTKVRSSFAKKNLAATLTVEEGDEARWGQLLLSHESGPEIAVIERSSLVEDDDLVTEEVAEFLEEIEG